MRHLILLPIAFLLLSCASQSGVNIAAPDEAKLKQNNQQEVQTTNKLGQDVTDSKDLVRRIDYKDSLLNQ